MRDERNIDENKSPRHLNNTDRYFSPCGFIRDMKISGYLTSSFWLVLRRIDVSPVKWAYSGHWSENRRLAHHFTIYVGGPEDATAVLQPTAFTFLSLRPHGSGKAPFQRRQVN